MTMNWLPCRYSLGVVDLSPPSQQRHVLEAVPLYLEPSRAAMDYYASFHHIYHNSLQFELCVHHSRHQLVLLLYRAVLLDELSRAQDQPKSIVALQWHLRAAPSRLRTSVSNEHAFTQQQGLGPDL